MFNFPAAALKKPDFVSKAATWAVPCQGIPFGHFARCQEHWSYISSRSSSNWEVATAAAVAARTLKGFEGPRRICWSCKAQQVKRCHVDSLAKAVVAGYSRRQSRSGEAGQSLTCRGSLRRFTAQS